MRGLLILIITGLLSTTPARAWHETGHKATAAIAFGEISFERQRAVISALRAHPRFEEDFQSLMPADVLRGSEFEKGRWLFEQASIWPDLVAMRDDEVRNRYHRSRWHYINLTVWLTDEDRGVLERKLDHNRATEFTPPLRQNLNIVQALRGNVQIWHDADASDAEKAVALCWILHLIGDLHQPLHTVALFSQAFFPHGDRGGNNIEVRRGDEIRNLHAVWDALPSDLDNLDPSAGTLLSIPSDEVSDEAIDEWLRHHARLADKFVYTNDVKAQLLESLQDRKLPTLVLSHEYIVSARTIARRQVNLAGQRIARLIE